MVLSQFCNYLFLKEIQESNNTRTRQCLIYSKMPPGNGAVSPPSEVSEIKRVFWLQSLLIFEGKDTVGNCNFATECLNDAGGLDRGGDETKTNSSVSV